MGECLDRLAVPVEASRGRGVALSLTWLTREWLALGRSSLKEEGAAFPLLAAIGPSSTLETNQGREQHSFHGLATQCMTTPAKSRHGRGASASPTWLTRFCLTKRLSVKQGDAASLACQSPRKLVIKEGSMESLD